MERRQGCIISLASRAGTVNAPFAAAYGAAKAGLIRTTAVMQMELEIGGFEDSIHMYALHPGGPRTTIFGIDDDVRERFPHMGPIWDKFHSMFRADPALPGQVCAFLAAGKGKALRGKYFDCEQNIEQVLSQGREGLQGLYDLKVDFMGGLPNDGGAVPAPIEDHSQTIIGKK
jgi:NAD(P)-dependent dehydrogenase (short-subunit alcohol dehydrogenase family)